MALPAASPSHSNEEPKAAVPALSLDLNLPGGRGEPGTVQREDWWRIELRRNETTA